MAQESDLVRKLSALGTKAGTVTTTIRLRPDTFKRLKEQHKKWDVTMSYLIEEALQPVLAELENAEPPHPDDDATE